VTADSFPTLRRYPKSFGKERDENLDLFVAKTWKRQKPMSQTLSVRQVTPNI
jgi:hypothetical protein